LQEADIIMVSKIDLLSQEKQVILKQLMADSFPGIPICYQDNLSAGAAGNWLATIEASKPVPRLSLDIDYAIYGAGEAALAWLDAELELSGDAAVSATEKLVLDFHKRIRENNLPIGHLKFLVDTGKAKSKISFTATADKNAGVLNLPISTKINLMVNARVETAPEKLQAIFANVMNSLGKLGITISLRHLNYFQPGFPVPQHRVLALL
jgi:hypothetical protein